MSITLRPPVRPDPVRANFDQATSTLILVALAATAPALLVRMLSAVGHAAGNAPGARPMWDAVAAVVRVLGLGGLAVLGSACAAAAVAAMRPARESAGRGGEGRVAALYAAGVVAAGIGLALLA